MSSYEHPSSDAVDTTDSRLEVVVPVSSEPKPTGLVSFEPTHALAASGDQIEHQATVPTVSAASGDCEQTFSITNEQSKCIVQEHIPQGSVPPPTQPGDVALPNIVPPPLRDIAESFAGGQSPEDQTELEGLPSNADAHFKEVEFELPQWFQDNCVKTAEALKKQSIKLSIRNDKSSDEVSQSTTEHAEMYEMDAVVYGTVSAVRRNEEECIEDEKSLFRYDAIYLRYPVKENVPKAPYDPVSYPYGPDYEHPPRPPPMIDPYGAYGALFGPVPHSDLKRPVLVPNGTNKFLSAIVEHFAKESEADLVTLALDDLRDLIAHFTLLHGISRKSSGIDYELVREYCDRDPHNPTKNARPYYDMYGPPGLGGFPEVEKEAAGPAFPWKTVLAASIHMKASISPAKASRSPLVVHIPDTQQLLGTVGENILSILKEEVQKLRAEYSSVILIFTSPEHVKVVARSESTVLRAAGTEPMLVPLIIAPAKSEGQILLFSKHQAAENSKLLANIRKLKYAMRVASTSRNISILEPYTPWDFLMAIKDDAHFLEEEMTGDDTERLVHNMRKCYDDKHILSVIAAFGRAKQFLEPWWPAIQERHTKLHEQQTRDKWSSYPPHVQEVVRRIQKDPFSYAAEKEFLNFVIDPKDIEQGWADIEIEERIKETIVQLVDQSFASSESAYGILKRARIGGALLYGPPGTGKTQLARVVAHESDAAMLCVSGADIEQKYVGETEKGIQALFKLGRMLYPSIIFIDEADGLFQGRDMDTHEYSRSRKNQLLTEMDGLMESKTPPFILLATNYPRHLDHAVLRRVPSLLHLGLPLVQARKKIFDIYLRDEILDEDVDTKELATKTRGYSGSDIKTVCVQTALSCRTFVDRGGRTMRILKNEQFLAVLKRHAPTTSRSALEEISAFSDDHDPLAMETTVDQELDINEDWGDVLSCPVEGFFPDDECD